MLLFVPYCCYCCCLLLLLLLLLIVVVDDVLLLMMSYCLLQFSGGASAINQIAETPTQVKKVTD